MGRLSLPILDSNETEPKGDMEPSKSLLVRAATVLIDAIKFDMVLFCGAPQF